MKFRGHLKHYFLENYGFCRSAAPPLPGSLLALADEVDTTQATNQVKSSLWSLSLQKR